MQSNQLNPTHQSGEPKISISFKSRPKDRFHQETLNEFKDAKEAGEEPFLWGNIDERGPQPIWLPKFNMKPITTSRETCLKKESSHENERPRTFKRPSSYSLDSHLGVLRTFKNPNIS